MRLDAEARKFRAVNRCGAVVAHLADVTRAQSPLLASHHGGGDLPSRQDLRGTKLHLGSARRIVSNGDKRVGGVEPHADNVNLGRFGHLAGATLKDARKFSKVERPIQWKRVVCQRVRPQIRRRNRSDALKRTAGPQRKDICGTRAIVAKTTKMLVAPPTRSQSHALRPGLDSPAS